MKSACTSEGMKESPHPSWFKPTWKTFYPALYSYKVHSTVLTSCRLQETDTLKLEIEIY